MLTNPTRAAASRLERRRYAGAFALTATPLLLCWLGVSCVFTAVNLAAVLLACAAYCYFAVASFALSPRKLGILVGSLLSAPVVLVFLTLPLTGLGLMFILGDSAAPYTDARMPNGWVCRTQVYGYAFSDEGQDVELLRPLAGIAFFTMAHARFSDRDDDAPADGDACAYLYERRLPARK